MPRLLTILAGLAVAFPLVAAPVPNHLRPKGPLLNFPAQVGTTWLYEGTYGKQTIVISSVTEEKDGAKLVTTEYVREDGTRAPHMVRRVSAEGLFLVAHDGKKYVEPWCIMKLNYREGQEWWTSHRLVGETADIVDRTTVVAVEKVRVPAGEFSAVRVERLIKINGTSLAVTYWYANGIGMIQLDENMKLKSFALGKD